MMRDTLTKLEKARPLFFLIGLIVALILVIGSFEYRVPFTPSAVIPQDTLALVDDEIAIVTIRKQPDKPKENQQKFNRQLPPEIIPDPFPDPDPDPDPVPPHPIVDTAIGKVELPDGWDDEPEPMHISVVQRKPIFKGCENLSSESERYTCLEQKLQRFLAENTEYPESLRRMDVEGRAFVEFTIDRQGQVVDVHAVGNRADHRLEEEAVKAVSQLPSFTPGKHNGLPVHVKFVVPVNFRLR